MDKEKGESSSEKKPMTDAERLALCQKMDEELDDFINSLERKRYTEGWPEDRWEEEMDKHPFFMKKAPENGELSPLAEGLAQIKYDPIDNTPLELATNYKEDGNYNFKYKNYRLAILGYTEGIRVKCGDPTMEASLYNNRAAAHWQLKNYRSALIDSEKALTFDSNHSKARTRAAKAAFQISKFDVCINHCEEILKSTNDKDIVELLSNAKRKKFVEERDQRKKDRNLSKLNEQEDAVIKAIIERGIKVANCDDEDDLDLSKLEPVLPGADDSKVCLEDGILKFPVLFLYPEFQMTDFINSCPENVALLNQLELLFPSPWDKEKKYSCDKVNVYFEGRDVMPHVVSLNKTLGEILVDKYFELKAGTPSFFILPKGSSVEKSFLESYL